MKKNLLLFCFYSFATLLSAQNKNIFRVTNIDSIEIIALDKFWKFNNGDDSTWALSSFDDSGWDTINTKLKFGKDGSNPFKGIGWFRIHIYIDSTLDELPLAILVDQDGASQVFLDGKLIHSFGTVSADRLNEKTYNPNEIPISFRYGKSGEHTLAVRYSNVNYRKFFEKYNNDNPGFTMMLSKQDDLIIKHFNENISNTTVGLFLIIFFFTLSFVHFLIFLFYRKRRTNLYYSVFVALLGMLFLLPTISGNTNNPELSIKLNYYFLFLLPTFFYSMLLLEYSLFLKSFRKNLAVTTAIIVLIGAVITILFGKNDYLNYFIFSFIIGTVFASFSIVIKSINKKKDGAWIIGTGSLLFLFFMGIIIILIMLQSRVHFSLSVNGFSGMLLFILVLLVIMSIPISMSIFLAREFAQTNKNLENKLVEVEALSAKSIEQEKEKQKILETQKETLEIQVKERTSEIVEQKKVIEEKNKDITDSINYAKTIQEAILPTKELKYKLFHDSFILFKPKDIVSGDFYWFTEKKGKKIIASCDCTGHGVPGALMSMIGANILNQIVNEKGITTPNEILNNLHKEIRKTLNQEEQTENKDGMDISIITFNNETEIEFSGAQRPLWIVRKTDNEELTIDNDRVQQLTEIKGDKFAIGGFQSETERTFTNHKVSLSKGECIYIFSDGFADQFSDIDKKLMTSRFKELLISIQQKSMPEQEIFLSDYIEKWRGAREQIDDILVIGIRI